jgi:hypothetical protein
MDVDMQWYFPPSEGAAGFNNAAIDTFKAGGNFSLVRESIQNSLDAIVDSGSPVHVAITNDELDIEFVSGVLDLRESLDRARKAAIVQGGEKSKEVKFFDNALRFLDSRKTVKVLGIHDFNTKGLGGPINARLDEDKYGGWLALVMSDGLSSKNRADSGGSFGHGSKANFAYSQLRTVFYYTETVYEGRLERRFKGKSILHSHNVGSVQTSATGYFGRGKKADALVGSNIPAWPLLLRSKMGKGTGTSVFMPYPYWENVMPTVWDDFQAAIVANFYLSIRRGQLTVTLGNGKVIDQDSLSSCLEESLKKFTSLKVSVQGDLDAIYRALKASEVVNAPTESGSYDSSTFGLINWWLKSGDSVKTKSVSISRNGMLITQKARRLSNFPGTGNFELFVSIDGLVGSETLRALENPAHNEFEFGPGTDAQLKKKYDAFADELREFVLTKAIIEIEDEKFIGDLDDLFGGYESGGKKGKSTSEQGERSSRLIVGSITRKSIDNGSVATETHDEGETPGRGELGGEGSRNKKGGNIPDPNGEGIARSSRLKTRQLKDVRVVRKAQTSGVARVYFSPISISVFEFQLVKSGENDRELLPIRLNGEKEWTTSVPFRQIAGQRRCFVDLELPEEAFQFAFEGQAVIADEN